MNVSLRHTVSVTDAFAVKTKHESISLSAHITTQTTHITHTGRPSVDPEHVAIFPQLKCITLLCFVYSRCVLYRRLKPTIILRSPADLFIWVRCRVSWIKSPQRFASLPLLPLHRVSHGANGHTGARVSPLQSPSFVHDLLQSHPCCPPPAPALQMSENIDLAQSDSDSPHGSRLCTTAIKTMSWPSYMLQTLSIFHLRVQMFHWIYFMNDTQTASWITILLLWWTCRLFSKQAFGGITNIPMSLFASWSWCAQWGRQTSSEFLTEISFKRAPEERHRRNTLCWNKENTQAISECLNFKVKVSNFYFQKFFAIFQHQTNGCGAIILWTMAIIWTP